MTTKKLDIFDTLKAIDKNNTGYYESLTEDEKKGFTPLVVMRWFSAVPDNSSYKDYHLQITNNILNKDFWELQKHPELVWKLMSICGTGEYHRHSWIPMPKTTRASKLEDLISDLYPSANDMEISIIINSFKDEKEFIEFINGTGANGEDYESAIKAYKSYKKGKTSV